MTSKSAPQARSRMPMAGLWFAAGWLVLVGVYVGSALLFADSLALRHPTRSGELHPHALINAVLALVLAYTSAAAWLARRSLRDDFEALRPVVAAGTLEWEQWESEIVRPPLGPLVRAAGVGALLGLLVISAGVAWATPAASVWAGHRIWSWLLNPMLFAAMAVFAQRGAHANRIFAALGERVRVPIGSLEGLAPFARAGLRRAVLWLLGSSLAALMLPNTEQPGIVLVVLAVTLALGVASLFTPSRTLHRRMREVKQAELSWVRSEIARAGDALRGHGDPARGQRLPALIAWEARVADAPVWPFDVSTKLRFALLLLVPLGSWLGGAMVERVVEAWFAG
jgi:hypothetical protein